MPLSAAARHAIATQVREGKVRVDRDAIRRNKKRKFDEFARIEEETKILVDEANLDIKIKKRQKLQAQLSAGLEVFTTGVRSKLVNQISRLKREIKRLEEAEDEAELDDEEAQEAKYAVTRLSDTRPVTPRTPAQAPSDPMYIDDDDDLNVTTERMNNAHFFKK